ncbi:OLC1v1036003C1 [Oldenlandia corymbosa var. corymbosa]|uniref:OLC1v1036003C1 n=1 Tax=Oldenlandia corymbosa var. corymbosa TaxID=529605 RepID=A0AAV1CVE3_OLDCO|nr:OLC1v1036003C1 [Oldenlandia corymbosa var. corymbosa]
MGFSLRRIAALSVVLSFCVLFSFASFPPSATALKGIDVGNPAVDVTPSTLVEHDGSKGAALCERVQVSGISRLKLAKYVTAYRVMVAPSVVIPERLHHKIQICIQRNSSLGLCQCGKDDWKNLQKGVLMSVGSPYEDRYIDVKFAADLSGSVTVTIQEDFQQWRLGLLALGVILFFLAPVISSWVPFYYSSSMAIGICVVVLILLFQGMKLLPTNRKNFFYLTIYGSVLGAGSFLLKHFSMMVNSLLVNFGLSEEMHNPVSVFLFVGIVIAGAGLGYWLVRKFVIAEDGSVDVGIAQFVKWAIRTIAVTLILQSTLDTPLAILMLGSCLLCYFLFTSVNWDEAGLQSFSQSGSSWPWSTDNAIVKHKHAEFYSRPWKKDPRSTIWDIPKGSFPKSPVKGILLSHFLRSKYIT